MKNDLLSALMRSMQISASLLLSERYWAPWRVALPDSVGLSELFDLDPRVRVMAFHLVLDGAIEIETGADRTERVDAGNVAIFFRGGAHAIGFGSPATTTSLTSAMGGEHPGAPRDAATPASSHCVCGAFTMQFCELNPLFNALPDLAVLSLDSPDNGGWLRAVAKPLIEEIEHPHDGSAFVIDRLLELFCVAAIREYMAGCGPGHQNWFGAMHDDVVLKTLRTMHASPAQPWTVDALASKANISRSRLSERFSRALGEPPMQYLAKWRMNEAIRLLANTRHSVQRVANEVGYDSLAAFSRAFKHHVGVSPATFRAERTIARNAS